MLSRLHLFAWWHPAADKFISRNLGSTFFGLLLCREARASGGDPAMAEQIQQRMETAMAKYLTIKAALLEPETLRLMMEMTSATCDLLVQVGKTFVLFCPEESRQNEVLSGIVLVLLVVKA